MTEKVKKPFYKKWWVWLIAIFIIFAAAGGGGGEESAKSVAGNAKEEASSQEKKTEAKTESAEKKAEPVKEVFAVGEKVQLGDNVLTVTNVEKSAGSDFDQPKDGNEFVIVTVEINNAGDENISYNPFDFKMANSQGQIVDQAFTTINNDTSLQSGELAGGGKVSGTIAFEQPAGDAGLQLHYTPSFWSDKTIKVNLQ
jgi:hypothetical protein